MCGYCDVCVARNRFVPKEGVCVLALGKCTDRRGLIPLLGPITSNIIPATPPICTLGVKDIPPSFICIPGEGGNVTGFMIDLQLNHPSRLSN
jgi:hypothetical protein